MPWDGSRSLRRVEPGTRRRGPREPDGGPPDAGVIRPPDRHSSKIPDRLLASIQIGVIVTKGDHPPGVITSSEGASRSESALETRADHSGGPGSSRGAWFSVHRSHGWFDRGDPHRGVSRISGSASTRGTRLRPSEESAASSTASDDPVPPQTADHRPRASLYAVRRVRRGNDV